MFDMFNGGAGYVNWLDNRESGSGYGGQTSADIYTEMIGATITRMGGYNQDTLGEMQLNFDDPNFQDMNLASNQQKLNKGEERLLKAGEIVKGVGGTNKTPIQTSGGLMARYNKQKSNLRRARKVAQRGASIYGDIGKAEFSFRGTGYEHNPLEAEAYYDEFDQQVAERTQAIQNAAFGNWYNTRYSNGPVQYTEEHREQEFERWSQSTWLESGTQHQAQAQLLHGMLTSLGDEGDSITVADLMALQNETADRDIFEEQLENFRELYAENAMNLQDGMLSLNESEMAARGLTAEGMAKSQMSVGARRREAAKETVAKTEQSINKTERAIDQDFQKSLSALTDAGSGKKKKVQGVSFKKNRAL